MKLPSWSEWREMDAAASEGEIVIPPCDTPKVSIVIPIYNQLGYTLRCLRSIVRHSDMPYEVILVDDCSSWGVFWHLSQIPNLRLVRNFSNLGFVLGCNRGASFARGDYIVLLNNDTEVSPLWLSALAQTFAIDFNAGLVGAKLVYPDRTLQEAGGIVWRDGSAWNWGRGSDPEAPEYNYLREADYISGACIMLKTEFWKELGGFDPTFAPAYYEDTDLAFRVRQKGKKVLYQPRSQVVHHEGKSNGTDVGRGIKSYQVRNQTLFYERWRKNLESHYPNAINSFRAKDRAVSRKVVLFIDHYVPHFDRDAGSRSVFSILKALCAANFVVKFVGDNFYPHQPYTSTLQQMGIEVIYGERRRLTWLDWLADMLPQVDYVFLSRAHSSLRWIGPIRACFSGPILFYGHDLISRTLRRAYEDLGDASQLLESERYQLFEEQVIPQADWIFYPSQVEVDLLRQKYPGKRIERIPLLAIDFTREESSTFSQRSGLLFVGGFGHAPNCDSAKWMLSVMVSELRELGFREQITIAGSKPTEELRQTAVEGVSMEFDISDERLAQLYRTSRIAVVPLRFGGGIKGKVLEAMGYSLPVVTTPIGAEGIWREGEMHLVCVPLANLTAAVVRLYNDEIAWLRVQSAAWRFLGDEYSTEALSRVLDRAMPGADPKISREV